MTRTTRSIVRGNKHFQKPTTGICCHLLKVSYLSGVHSAWPCDFPLTGDGEGRN